MGRIVTSVSISNVRDPSKTILFDALVDTGATYLVLPSAWKERLGELEVMDVMDFETATQGTVRGEICGPVQLKLEGFRSVFTEVSFVDMHPEDGIYEPLIGYTALELSHAAVDMVGHRLMHVRKLDLK